MSSPPTPRISVNKPGEFLTARRPPRRHAIVRDQRQPPPQVVPLYRQAAEPIADFLNGGGVDVEALAAAADRIRSGPAPTEWAENDNRNTAAALECFLECADQLPLEGITYIRGDQSPPYLQVGLVNVSVRPEFILHFERRGRLYVGALKIHFVKDDEKALGEPGQQYVGTAIRQWLLTHGPSGRRRGSARPSGFNSPAFRLPRASSARPEPTRPAPTLPASRQRPRRRHLHRPSALPLFGNNNHDAVAAAATKGRGSGLQSRPG